jgi:hypothetical protein
MPRQWQGTTRTGHDSDAPINDEEGPWQQHAHRRWGWAMTATCHVTTRMSTSPDDAIASSGHSVCYFIIIIFFITNYYKIRSCHVNDKAWQGQATMAMCTSTTRTGHDDEDGRRQCGMTRMSNNDEHQPRWCHLHRLGLRFVIFI